MPLVAACAPETNSLSAFCDALQADVAAHANALANSPHDASVLTGDLVIQKYDAVCP